MSGIQFMHAEGYSRNGSKLKGAKGVKKGEKRKQATGGWSARQILSEVLREPESCRHVQHPQPPMSVYGNMEALVAGIVSIPDKRKGIRGDTPIMLTGIASAPWPPGDERSVKWHKDVVEHLLKKFGDDLKVIVAHVDEPHDHLHFYIALHDYQPIKGIHPGMKMRDETKAAGGTDAEINKAYKDAMI